ncbi:Protein of unknown function [Bacillus mycoides]|nr:Protein of unknown function [Bacillus mycoides]
MVRHSTKHTAVKGKHTMLLQMKPIYSSNALYLHE